MRGGVWGLGAEDRVAAVPGRAAARASRAAPPSGTWLWRSTFLRRVFRPAVDGSEASGTKAGCAAVRPGLTFHGLRHSPKTWMIADGAPEIAQARRLGHHLDNRVTETYSHVAPEVEQRLLDDLEHRWHTAAPP
jgi:integrase